MFVVPYIMGPEGSSYSRVGVEITDSPYVVANLRIMARIGNAALADSAMPTVVRGLHSLGDLSPERRFILHFPERRTIWSIGSGYGGNALLGKNVPCPPHCQRPGSRRRLDGRAHDDYRDHGAQGRKTYVAAAFPSACGKTNLAMLVPSLPGCNRNGGRRHLLDARGRRWAALGSRSRGRILRRGAGTSAKTNPNAVARCRATSSSPMLPSQDGTPWWEGMGPLR